jgi:hypothetical protein
MILFLFFVVVSLFFLDNVSKKKMIHVFHMHINL